MKSEKATFIGLDFLFVAVAGVAALYGQLPAISPDLFWVILGLAAYRFGRALSFNLIFKWVRDLVGIVDESDSSGAGDSSHATGTGPYRVIGELLCCPICSGTWAALAFLALYAVAPGFGRVMIYAQAAAGIAEVLTWVSEYFEWGGRQAREVAGSYWLEKNPQPEPEANEFAGIGQDIVNAFAEMRSNGNGR